MLYDIKNLAKSYVGRDVLNNLSFSLEKGKVTGLLGPNGAGKTTLLEVLAFLSAPTSGEIWYKKSRVQFGKADLISLRKEVVLLQQKPILFTTTVFNNIEFPLRIRNIEKNEREKKIDQLLCLVGMERFSQARAQKLSGGETQRVAIAQALACSPEVILMDEPFSSVDVENQIIIEGIIREINRLKGISVIFTTHDRIQASRLADNILFIHKGKLSKSINENFFSGRIERNSAGDIFCVIVDGVKIPLITERTGQVRISINGDAVKIQRRDDIAGSRHTVTGRVIQLTDEKEHIRALIDIGLPLSIIVKRNEDNELLPAIGENVRLDFNPEKIEVI
jgi:tungstate transport system ATP-binding protein